MISKVVVNKNQFKMYMYMLVMPRTSDNCTKVITECTLIGIHVHVLLLLYNRAFLEFSEIQS